MREIKFRYIWKRPDRWAGPYSPSDDKFKITYLSLEDIEEGRKIRPCVYPDYKYSILVARDEYTGLKDKNGKEIYEGDIVSANYQVMTSRYKVVIEDGHTELIHPIPPPMRFFLDLANRELYEVIGNIYENKELLVPEGDKGI